MTPKCSNKRSGQCTRYVTLHASFIHKGQAGTNRFKFNGRLGGRKLAPGRYRLRSEAIDPAGNKSPVQDLPFRIIAG